MMLEGNELSGGRKIPERLALQDRLRPVGEIPPDLLCVEHEETAVDEALANLRFLVEFSNVGTIKTHLSEAARWPNVSNGGHLAVASVKPNELPDVHVTNPVAVRDGEEIVGIDIPLYGEHPAPRLGRFPRLGERDTPIFFVVSSVELQTVVPPKGHGHVRRHRTIVQEKLLDEPALVAKTENELPDSMGGVALHDVPHDGLAANWKHRLRQGLACVADPRSLSAAKDDCFHGFIFLLEQ